jgi:hypothetical protein
VPIRAGGNDVVGVFATGSLSDEKPALLNQIEHLIGVIIEDLFPERFGRTASQVPPSEYLNGLSKREIEVYSHRCWAHQVCFAPWPDPALNRSVLYGSFSSTKPEKTVILGIAS